MGFRSLDTSFEILLTSFRTSPRYPFIWKVPHPRLSALRYLESAQDGQEDQVHFHKVKAGQVSRGLGCRLPNRHDTGLGQPAGGQQAMQQQNPCLSLAHFRLLAVSAHHHHCCYVAAFPLPPRLATAGTDVQGMIPLQSSAFLGLYLHRFKR
jgi:hypothetical protein